MLLLLHIVLYSPNQLDGCTFAHETFHGAERLNKNNLKLSFKAIARPQDYLRWHKGEDEAELSLSHSPCHVGVTCPQQNWPFSRVY